MPSLIIRLGLRAPSDGALQRPLFRISEVRAADYANDVVSGWAYRYNLDWLRAAAVWWPSPPILSFFWLFRSWHRCVLFRSEVVVLGQRKARILARAPQNGDHYWASTEPSFSCRG